LPKTLFHIGFHFGEFCGASFAVCCIARGEQASRRIVQNFHSHGNMPDAHAEIDQRLPFPLRIPTGYISGSCLQLERSRDAIVGLELIIPGLLAVFMQIDKSRRNDKPLRIHRRLPLQRTRRNRANFATANPHVAHRVQPGFRVHHPAIRDDHVISLVVRRAPCSNRITQPQSRKNNRDSERSRSSRCSLPHFSIPL
jgi:hypothetical protein